MGRIENLAESLYFDYLTPKQRVDIFNFTAQAYNGYQDLRPNLGNISRYALGGIAISLLGMIIPSGTNPEVYKFNASEKERERSGVVSKEVEPSLIPPTLTLTPTQVPTRTFTAVSTATPKETPTRIPATATSTQVPPTSTPTSTPTPTETKIPPTLTKVPPTITSTETPTPLKPPESLKPSFEDLFRGNIKIAEGQTFWQVLKQVLSESSIIEKPWVNKENNISQIDVLVDWVIKYAQAKGVDLSLLMPDDEINLKMLVNNEEIAELKKVAETKDIVGYLNYLASLP